MDEKQLIIIIFALLYFGFIIYTRKKGDFEEFSVAGRSLGVFLIFTTICASYIGPAMTLGLARDGFSNGMLQWFFGVFNGFALIWVAFYYAPKIREKFIESNSIGDVIAGPKTHNHKAVKIATGIIAAWMMASIAIAMSYAGGELINNIFGFSKFWSIVIITSIVIVYSSFGGIRATIQTDAFQFLNFVILIPILAILMVMNDKFSWSEWTSFATGTTSAAFDATSFAAILGFIVFWAFSGTGFDAAVINRFLAARDKGVAKRAALFAGVFIFFWMFIMVFIGNAGAFLHPNYTNDDQVLLHIAENYYPGILYGLFIVAMIGVVMSTQDTTLNASAIVFSEDILGGFYPDLSDEKKLRYSKVFTVIVGIIAIFIAGFLTSILNAIIVIFSFYMPVLIPVILFSVFKKSHNWQSASASMVVGFLSYVIWDFVGSEIFPSILAATILSTISYCVTDKIIEIRSV